jgi:hypothetical protein
VRRFILLAALAACCAGCGGDEKKGGKPDANPPRAADVFDKMKDPAVKSKSGSKFS